MIQHGQKIYMGDGEHTGEHTGEHGGTCEGTYVGTYVVTYGGHMGEHTGNIRWNIRGNLLTIGCCTTIILQTIVMKIYQEVSSGGLRLGLKITDVKTGIVAVKYE